MSFCMLPRWRTFAGAKAQGKLGILFHFQNTLPLEQSIELLDVYKALGVRVIQLTYNVKNFVGDGCLGADGCRP